MLHILNRDSETLQISEEATRTAVIGKSLDLLSQIHLAIVSPADDYNDSPQLAPDGEDAALEDARRRRLLNAMLDLISLEGLYPSLSSGVGIPLQQRVISVLPAGVIAKQTSTPESIKPHNQALLIRIMEGLLNILLDGRPSIQPILRARILSDIVSGTADLGFNPHTAPGAEKARFQDAFVHIIKEYVSVVSSCAVTDKLKYSEYNFVTDVIKLSPIRDCCMVQIDDLKPNIQSATSTRRSSANDNVHCVAIRPIAWARSPTATFQWPALDCPSHHANFEAFVIGATRH